ncbi:MAG: ATP-dependent DNA helicase RecG [Deltaproteobacteria bacterium]|nr:ATP-dependent DNA helicase RecG [Deltaproteobacteria bacterium]
MKSLDEIAQKMEAPVTYAAENDYVHLSQVKNLGMVMISLVRQLKEGIRHEEHQSRKEVLDRLAAELKKQFSDFDKLTAGEKKERLSRAAAVLSDLKAALNDLPGADDEKRPRGGGVLHGGDHLFKPVQQIRGVGPRIAALLAKMNLITTEDLLYFIPRRYEDRRIVSRIAETVPGQRQTVIGRIKRIEFRFYGRRRIFEVYVDDGSSVMLKARWFKGREAYLRSAFKLELRVILTGKVSGFPFDLEMIHPDFEILNDQDDQLLHFKRIVPIYSETEGLHQKTLRRILWTAVRDFTHLLQSPIPEDILEKRHLIGLQDAIRQVHFPPNDQAIDELREVCSDAHQRLVYDEFFFFQLAMAVKKMEGTLDHGISFRVKGKLLDKFYGLIPFRLTSAQQRVIDEIEQDMASTRRMSRLLEGDVGSGKTVVAMAAMVTACENGYQCAIMSPTEILSAQHYRNIRVWAEQLGLETALLTGSLKPSVREKILRGIAGGKINLIVGTHALIQEGVSFQNLGLVVIDEQHRFGVVQRAQLRGKGQFPDVLVMTATPIPRTLAMTVYGDLDLSVIDELPPQKNPVRTKLFSEAQRSRVYEIVRGEVEKGNQVFIVYPLATESERLDLKDATRMADHLGKAVFPDFRIGLVHGQMKPSEKEHTMNDFARKKIQILVSTTVIEVGIDIPEASLMVIEHAERFGLSQLHQLRGRVGRSDIPSYCILMTQKSGSRDSHRRLRIMEKTNNGFEIAEEDLAIRGPGEFIGTRQSGLPDFRIANILRDGRILNEAKEDAFRLVEDDPGLERLDHHDLRAVLLRRWGARFEAAKTA